MKELTSGCFQPPQCTDQKVVTTSEEPAAFICNLPWRYRYQILQKW